MPTIEQLTDALEASEKRAQFLWRCLDNIDTADDLFKTDDKAFRQYAREQQKERWNISTSDGHTITWTFPVKEDKED